MNSQTIARLERILPIAEEMLAAAWKGPDSERLYTICAELKLVIHDTKLRAVTKALASGLSLDSGFREYDFDFGPPSP